VLGWPFLAVGECDPRLEGFVRALRPALIVTAGDRSILTPELARSAPLGAIRLHPGLLPRWSGPFALQLAIASGERELSVTRSGTTVRKPARRWPSAAARSHRIRTSRMRWRCSSHSAASRGCSR
jgi:hypothetical protein